MSADARSVAFPTVKLRLTGVAGRYATFPTWSARTVHVPAPTIVIVEPLAPLDVHTAVVVGTLNVTGSNESLLAPTTNGASP